MRWGVGAGASRLVSGTMTIHRRLEERLAAFAASEACVLFGSGYLANVGLIGALAGHGDAVFSDELNHASIVDGCRLSHAEVVVYRHGDVEHLDWLLRRRRKSAASKGAGARSSARAGGGPEAGQGTLIVTDSVFSMDGDVAPIEAIVEIARLHGARVAVDEAHAIGACGPGGRGVVAQAGLEPEVDVIVGTLGKALASYGAYVCADRELVRYLINTARPLIFSTAPPPPAVAGALAALELLQERPQRVQRLRSNARVLRRALATEGFPVLDGETHIVALVVGDEHAAMRLCQEAVERGVFAQAIRPPAVPAGTARLRLAAMASHTVAELRTAARALADAARAAGLDPTLFAPALAESESGPSEGDLERSAAAGEEMPSPIAMESWTDSSVPFDLERENWLPATAQLAPERQSDPAPVAAGKRRSDPAPVANETDPAPAVFDFERETTGIRAA
jgi:glycine C-acetyltransferase/8-amino-7-oxononanoate synthase